MTCGAWPAYICRIETTVMPQPAASGIDHTPLMPGTPSLCRSAQMPAERNAAQNSPASRSEEHTSELQSRLHLVCRLLLEKKKHTGADHNVSTLEKTIVN